jgi:hypothetical protein
LILVLLAASASMIHFLARPHVVSWLFTVAWFWVLESSERKARIDSSAPIKINNSRWLMAAASAHARMGECSRRISPWLRSSRDLLAQRVLAMVRFAKETGSTTSCKTFGQGSAPETWLSFGNLERAGNARIPTVGDCTSISTAIFPIAFLMDHIDEFQSPNFHGAAQKCFAGCCCSHW